LNQVITMKILMPRLAGIARAVATTIVLVLAGCGGGGSGLSGGGSPPPAQGVITGTVVKGPVSGASVTAYAISNGTMGARIASATTDAQGAFRLATGSHAGPVMLQASGGTYMDEAIGASMPMMAGDVMNAMLTSTTAGATVSGIHVTPLTSMAQTMAQHMAGGMSDANITSANGAVGSYFMVNDILHTQPMNPLTSGSGSAATQDTMNYGMAIAAMSQSAHGLGMSSSSAMVTAMMNDAADGILDGRMGGGSVMMGGMGGGSMMPATAGTSGLAGAMSDFLASVQNHSGVNAASMQALMNQLNGSNGHMGSGPSGSNTRVSGTVFNGPMGQAMVNAYAVNDGLMGAQLASAPTDGQGAFSLSMGSYAGPVMLQMSGGTYTDEATGQAMTMASIEVMTAVMATVSAGTDVTGLCITPLTSMAQVRAQAMTGAMNDANIASANHAVGAYFMVDDILQTPPMDPRLQGSGSVANQDMAHYGMTVAAMSQYAHSQGMQVSSAFVTAMMKDAADGTMNGMAGGSGGMMQGNAATSGLAGAMTDFVGGAMNQSGMTSANMNALIQKLASSDGKL
jgi:hypothetical protein